MAVQVCELYRGEIAAAAILVEEQVTIRRVVDNGVARIDRCAVAGVLEGRGREGSVREPNEDRVVQRDAVAGMAEVLDHIDIAAAERRGENEVVAAKPAIEDVTASRTVETIVAQSAAEPVGAGVAGDDVVAPVAEAVDAGRAGEGQVLDVAAQGVVDRGAHFVCGAATGILDDLVAPVIDDEGVVAGTADHAVGAEAAIEPVVAPGAIEPVGRGIAGDDVVEPLPGGVDRRGAGEGNALDMLGARRIGDGGFDVVGGTAARGLDGEIAGVVDDVGVVAAAAGHGVDAGAAVEQARSLPVCLEQRTSTDPSGWSVSCHNRTHAPQQTAHYSMTSSARARTFGGISSPSIFAVLRLMAKRNLVACWYGISPGLVPRKI